jgi:hypothetical protein
MKKILYLPVIVILTISLFSCNDDFLSKNNQNMYLLSDTLYLNSNQDKVDTTIQLPSLTNADFTIFMQPMWLSFNSMHGRVTDGIVPLSFSIIKDNIDTEYKSTFRNIILDVTNVGLISFVVAYSNYGSPTLQCSPASLNFESSESQTFRISNTSNGILNWEITGIPDWLILSVTSGSLSNGNSVLISVSLNFENIPTGGDLSEILPIKSNSINGNFYLPVRVAANAIIPPDQWQISGLVTDAEYNHQSGIMAICTKSPNSLIIFNTNTNESKTLPLSFVPNCVSLSEHSDTAVIGYSVSRISYIDIAKPEIIKDFSIDCIPYDIVLGENDWCYLTPTTDQWVYMRNLNLNSGNLIAGLNRNMIYERTILKKIPGKPYMVGSHTGLVPNGILIFDLTKGISNDTISYYHESVGMYWISADATKLYTGTKLVYKLPEYDGGFYTDAPPIYGQIESERGSICALDECQATNSIFTTSSDYYYQSGNSSNIEQFNLTNFDKIKTYTVSPVLVSVSGIITLYQTSAWYIFVNKEGSNLYALKNLREDYNKDYWTIEIIHPDVSGK